MDYQKLLKAQDGNFEDFLFYDIEVFWRDALVVFKDINGTTLRTFHNDFDGLKEFIKGKILVGYNNYYYDDKVLTAMITNKDNPDVLEIIKGTNDTLISDGRSIKYIDPCIFSLDCFQQINVARSSLKKVEANIGLSIDETAVDFNIQRELTQEELADTIKYCEQDVNATITIFKLRWFSYFIPKLMIVDMLPEKLKDKAIRWNTTTITATLLKGNKEPDEKDQWPTWQLGEKKDYMLSLVPVEVKEMWQRVKRIDLTADVKPKAEKCTIHQYGCSFEFSQGGLHGVNLSGRKNYKNVRLLDVTSLYPNILLKLEGLNEATDTYRGIVDRRVEVKHTDEVLSGALKLVINSTYGLLKNQYSKLYNPMAALSVCIYGQIILYDLCRRLYLNGCNLININTDGVAYVAPSDNSDMNVKEEWEKEWGFDLELSEFKSWTQKDVNNYVAVSKSGNIKVKGGEVNHYYDPVDYLSDPLHCRAGVNWSGTNTKSIIHHCIVEKLVNGKDFVDTVIENMDNPILFQYVLQCGNTYIGTVDEDGKEYQKVNRVFAAKKDGVTLKKLKEGCNPQYFPNAPKQMYVYNGDLRELENFKEIVDVNFYTALAEDKYNKLWK